MFFIYTDYTINEIVGTKVSCCTVLGKDMGYQIFWGIILVVCLRTLAFSLPALMCPGMKPSDVQILLWFISIVSLVYFVLSLAVMNQYRLSFFIHVVIFGFVVGIGVCCIPAATKSGMPSLLMIPLIVAFFVTLVGVKQKFRKKTYPL